MLTGSGTKEGEMDAARVLGGGVTAPVGKTRTLPPCGRGGAGGQRQDAPSDGGQNGLFLLSDARQQLGHEGSCGDA